MNKTDLKNLSFLKLFHSRLITDDECMSQIKWGNRTRPRTQLRYLKKLIQKLAKIDAEHPGMLDSQFETKIGSDNIKQIRKVNDERDSSKKSSTKKESSSEEG